MSELLPELEHLYQDLALWVRGGRTVEEAQDALLRLHPVSEDVEQIVREFRSRTRRFIDMTDPRVLPADSSIETWYQGPDFPGAWCWPAYKRVLLGKGWDAETAIEPLDLASTKILAFLKHPGQHEIRTRGLVVGYVQSGKTANYSALISKAADAGYKLFVVLAGMTSSLRRQTQRRLESEICDPTPSNWHTLTRRDQDFRESSNPDALLNPENHNTRIMCVVKKNVHILRRLTEFFGAAQEQTLRNCPVLVIDDEADQASVNTSKKAAVRSAINDRIVELLTTLPKAAYVGYTATPFANVFIDPAPPEDLYPRDFIFELDRPQRYFGAESVFGRERLQHDEDESQYDGMDVIREVRDPDEVRLLRPASRGTRFDFEPESADSLEDALRYFWMATACRYARGQQDHSTMLVHTTLYTHTHGQLRELVAESAREFAEALGHKDESLHNHLRTQWEEEADRVRGGGLVPDVPRTPFEDVLRNLNLVLERSQAVVDNGTLGAALDYTAGCPRVYVAVGGNTLSRGLTLEGLVVSYFIRSASAYDTLLQMGRWFGFRFGYEDLPRVWMTPALEANFMHLAAIEEEIRYDIRRYIREGKTPTDFGVRVRTHPRLAITSPLKMQSVKITSASYSDQREQTFLFKSEDGSWLAHNIAAGRRLVQRLAEEGNEARELGTVTSNRWLIEGASSERILEFLDDYNFHENHKSLDCGLIRKYIEAENQRSALKTWNVVVLGRRNRMDVLGDLDLGLPRPVPCINRSRYKVTQPVNIKALTSLTDRVVDLEIPAEGLKDLTDEDLSALRNEPDEPRGLLVLYPISRTSTPQRGQEVDCGVCGQRHRSGRDSEPPLRHPLNAAEHVLGVALFFPESASDMREYLVNNLNTIFDGSDLQDDIDDEELPPEIEESSEGELELEG